MRIKRQEELLDQSVRAKIIEEIDSEENQRRKDKAFKRFQIFKDQTKTYVIKELRKQFSETTVNEMGYCLSNISFVRKVVDKLARVYTAQVMRELDQATEDIGQLTKLLPINTSLKKVNKFLKLQKNVMLYVKPYPVALGEKEVYDLCLEVLNPYLYDVIENYYNREQAMCVVLSNYKKDNVQKYALNPASRTNMGRPAGIESTDAQGNSVDEIIADTASDAMDVGLDQYVFWSDKYHFTCNKAGEIISQDIVNPINQMPLISYAIDQDGQYWSEGGDDLIDAGVLVNSMLTHLNHIGVVQGYGQFYMKGKKLPTNVVVGPNKMIRLEYEEGDPVPEIGYAQANPALNELMKSIEMYVALVLTTNNLSTSGVSTQLNGSNSFASGISMMIDKSESMEDVKDQEQVFLDNERKVFSVIAAWLEVYGKAKVLKPELAALKIPLDMSKLVTKFTGSQVISTETEKLNNMKLRKDLGIATQLDLIMSDNPSMTKADAEAKLLEITKEKILRMTPQVVSMDSTQGGDNNGQQTKSETKTKEEEVVDDDVEELDLESSQS